MSHQCQMKKMALRLYIVDNNGNQNRTKCHNSTLELKWKMKKMALRLYIVDNNGNQNRSKCHISTLENNENLSTFIFSTNILPKVDMDA